MAGRTVKQGDCPTYFMRACRDSRGCHKYWELRFSGVLGADKKSRFQSGVTRIGSQAFYGCSGLTEVTIPAGVTSIESRAFHKCSGLKKVVIPDSVTRLRVTLLVGALG